MSGFSDTTLGSINLNIRWHQTQLLPWDYAYAYVTPGLHTDFSDISLSIKWKRFLSLMLMLMLMSLPVYTAYVYACVYVYAYAYAYVAV